MNFHIIDGYDELEKYEEDFIQAYNDPTIPATSIPSKLGLTINEYNRLRNQLHEDGKIELRRRIRQRNPKRLKKNKCYSLTRTGWFTYYQIVRNRKYYGTVKTEKQAKKMVELMEKVDWDKSKFNEIKAYVTENY